MVLSEDRIYEIAEAYGALDSEYRRAEFARAIGAEVRKECAAELAALRTERDHMEMAADAEARRVDELTALRKQDDALILQLVEALDDLVEAGEEAWSECRPCVRIGKKAATAGRAWLESKT